MLAVACPSCHANLQLHESSAGACVCCPQCSHAFDVPPLGRLWLPPERPPAVGTVAPAPPERGWDATAPPMQHGPRPSTPQLPSWPRVASPLLLVALAATGLAVVLVASLILSAALPRQRDPGQPTRDETDTGEIARDGEVTTAVPRDSRPADPRPTVDEPKPLDLPGATKATSSHAPAPAEERPADTPPAAKSPGEESPKEELRPPRVDPQKEAKRPAAEPEKSVKPSKVAIKRIQKLDDEELRKQLLFAPEVALDAVPNTSSGLMRVAARLQSNKFPYPGPVLLLGERPDLVGLPLRMGLDCRLGKEPAEDLQALSRKMRVHLEASIPRGSSLDPRPDPDTLRRELLGKDRPDWLRPEAIPALLQLLQAEGKSVRRVLVELLAKINHRRATEALAVRTVVDLSAEVREAAVHALRERPCEDYRELLLAGLRYPWIAVQQHAAEALVALRHEATVPQLVNLLNETPATLPFTITQHKKEVMVIRELVSVNHLSNCVLCHAPSSDRGDLVRGAVPTPGEPLPAPVTTPQYYERGGSFVRADITYLRQDFSVMQTVDNPGKWPSNQRHDYLVRLRRLTPREVRLVERAKKDFPLARLREPVLFALRELTGKDLGTEPEKWQAALRTGGKERLADGSSERMAPGDWGQFLMVRGTPQPDDTQRREAARLAAELTGASAAEQPEVLKKLREGKGVTYTEALATAIGKLEGDARQRAREALAERMTRMTSATLGVKLEDEDAEVRRAAALAVAMKEDKAHVFRLIEMLGDPEASVVRAVYAALKSLTGEDFGPARDATREDRAKAVAAWKTWWAKQQKK